MDRTAAAKIAREFVSEVVHTGRQWDVATLEGYLPRGLALANVEDGDLQPPTIARLTRIIQRAA